MLLKDINNDLLDKIVADRLTQYLGGNETELSDLLYTKIDELVLQRINKTIESLILKALGLRFSFNEWEINSTEFKNTRLAAHIFGPLQEAIIQKVGTVNVDAVASKIEKSIPKHLHDVIYHGIDSAVISKADAKIEEMLETVIGKALHEKLVVSIDKKLSERRKPPTKKKKAKKKKVPLLVRG